MHRCAHYALALHSGPYETWPRQTALMAHGVPTGTDVPGYQLLHQFALDNGALLITDWDCPYEERTDVLRLDRQHQVVASKSFAAPYASWLLSSCTVLDHETLHLTFHDDDRWEIRVDGAGRLGAQRLADSR